MPQQIKQIQLPQDLKAERAVIAAIISGNSDLDYVCSEIGEIDSFYLPEHRAIALAVLELSETNPQINKRSLIDYLDSKNNQKYNLQDYLKTINEIVINENELGDLCHRVRDCAMAREFIYKLSDLSQRLNEGDIDAIKFLQLTHSSLLEGTRLFMKPALVGFETCEIMDHLPELAKAEGWYVPLIKCLQSRWKKEGEQLSDVHN